MKACRGHEFEAGRLRDEDGRVGLRCLTFWESTQIYRVNERSASGFGHLANQAQTWRCPPGWANVITNCARARCRAWPAPARGTASGPRVPPGDEAGVVAVAAEVDRLGPDETAARASEQFHREPGEPGTRCQGEQVSGAEAQDGRDVRRDGCCTGAPRPWPGSGGCRRAMRSSAS